MTMIGTNEILELMRQGFTLALSYWWAYVPVILGFAAYEEYASYQRAKFIAGLKWVIIEVIPPPEILYSSPKAADSVFAGLHSSYAGFPGTSWKSQFFQGKIPVAFSFEIVSNGGEIRFYIRCLEDQRNVVESVIFAQYPQAEIRIINDYIDMLPAQLDLNAYDISGAELEFTKEQAYPIKTYVEFEEAGGKDEYARLDPIAPLLEVMSALKPGEHLWLQYIVRATGGEWVKEGQKIVDKLKGKKEEKAKPPLDWLFGPVDKLVGQALGLKSEEKKEEKAEFNLQKLTASERKVLEQVEYKLAKLGFKVGIRLVYTASKDSFDGSRIAGVTAMFKQLYYNNLNSFKPGNTTRDKGILKWMFPSDKGFFVEERIVQKKERMYEAYRSREFPKKNFPKKGGPELLVFLNTEELATLWHLPGLNVSAPLVPRVQAKKGQPPAILPTR